MYKKYLIGNAHLDPAWLWGWQEGYGEIRSTFAAAIKRLEEYPDFIFTCSSACYYKWIEELEPELFQQIKKYAEQGRWEIVGGWWIQSDCNIPSGETFVRQILYGQRYFFSRFGKTCVTGYNVDSFGHNGNLPQLLKKGGIENYIYQRPGQNEKKIAHSVYVWEAVDGSRVTTARLTHGYATATLPQLKEKIRQAYEESVGEQKNILTFYGVGNHGGGPTIEMLDYIVESMESGNKDQLLFATTEQYFKDLRENKAVLEVVKDDLQHHASGCYSANAMLKKQYRKAENALIRAEKYMMLSNNIAGTAYDAQKLAYLWETLLFNTFHDIICGCSIKLVCENSFNELGMIIAESEKLSNFALQRVSGKINTLKNENLVQAAKKLGRPLVIFNPHSWNVIVPVRTRILRTIDEKASEFIAVDGQGNTVNVQKIPCDHRLWDDQDGVFLAKVPAFGYSLYYVKGSDKQHDSQLKTAQIGDKIIADKCKVDYGYIEMENNCLRVRADRISGGITVFDKKNNQEVFASPAAAGVIYDDWDNDTWAHGVDYFDKMVGKFRCDSVEFTESGKVRATIKITGSYGNSVLTQWFTLYENGESIEVKVHIDWREKHKLVKLVFSVAVSEPENTYQIPYAHIRKKCTGEEQVSVGWFDISGGGTDGSYGVTVSSDAKYSFSAKENEIGMTIVRSSIYADHGGVRKEAHDYDYLDVGCHEFCYSIIPHKNQIDPAMADKKAAELNTDFEIITESYHGGSLGDVNNYCSISSDNIIAGAMKKAEDGIGTVLRLYESNGIVTKTRVRFFNWEMDLNFSSHEIKTIYISEDNTVEETDFLEGKSSQNER